MNAQDPTATIIDRMDFLAGCDDIESIPALESLHDFGGWAIPGTNFHDMRAAIRALLDDEDRAALIGVHLGSQLIRQAVADVLAKDLHPEELVSEIARVLQLDRRDEL